MKDKDLIIIHRGRYSYNYPENSIPAFIETIKNNKMIELDIHIIKDNTVIVFHDDNLKRMCENNSNVRDLTYKEICKFRLANSNYGIPTFKEVLNLVNGKVPLDIELKCDVLDGSLEEEAFKLLKDYNGKFILKSFHPCIVKNLKKLRKKYNLNCKIGLLVKNPSVLFFSLIVANPDFVSYNYKCREKLFFKIISHIKPTLLYTIKEKNVFKIIKNEKFYGYIVENYEDILD